MMWRCLSRMLCMAENFIEMPPVTDLRVSTYRTHTCNVLRPEHVGQSVRLAGWVHRKRDHGQLLFIDLRDHSGVTQGVFQPEHPFFEAAEGMRLESVLTVTGH